MVDEDDGRATTPAREDDGVHVRREPLTLPTYEPAPPARFPAFLDSRVYQGSSGSVYPLPFHERIAATPTEHAWDAIHLENPWISLTVLPELGGRIHSARDRSTGYDFVYRNDVIKPALVGLAGPWISGGVEFNWPQHHRPGTYLPTEAIVEHGEDGSVTVWCSDHDPFTRMKGMHGICLHPDRAVVEVKVRLHNRTDVTQTFLWWANLAARSHAGYQSFFPPDVHYVADHANRATISFPAADGPYYGIDYAQRRREQLERGQAEGGQAEGEPDANRLDWYRNIPVPTSYMVLRTEHGFFGGYDHDAGAGFVHWADPAVSPGKKLWTWGDAPFGHAWEANLADDGAHYVELMAGVHTNNQPDFSYLAPGETKTFSQFWYPFSALGPVQAATREAALTLHAEDGAGVEDGAGSRGVVVGAAVTRRRPGLRLELAGPGGTLRTWDLDLAPDAPFEARTDVPGFGDEEGPTDRGLRLTLTTTDGEVLAEHRPARDLDLPVPPPAREPAAPEEMDSVDELYLTGVHLAQYRHATRSPERWWRAALDRDPGDSRCNTAMGDRRLREGRYAEAEDHLERAVERLTALNGNPRDGEAHYLLGLVLLHRARLAGGDGALRVRARTLLERAAWDARWFAPAHLALGREAARSGQDDAAIAHLRQVLRVEPENLAARCALVVLLRRVGGSGSEDAQAEARALLGGTLDLDPLDVWARHLRDGVVASDAQHHLDLAREYASVGDLDAALAVLDEADAAPRTQGATNVGPLIGYARAAYLAEAGRPEAEVRAARVAAAETDATWCLPVTLDDVDALELAVRNDAADAADATVARASALLGAWRYTHGSREEARELWLRARAADPTDAAVLRNLGLLAVNAGGDLDEAWEHYLAAADLAPDDAQLLHEIDELAQRRGESVPDRLGRLEARPDLVAERDDLAVSLVTLRTAAGRAQDAVALLASRRFQPWEGGEGRVLTAWEHAHLAVARDALAAGDGARAVEFARAALDPPRTLGETRHPLANRAHVLLTLGDALAGDGREDEAEAAWLEAAAESGDFQEMASTPASELTYFSAVAARRLGDDARATHLIEALGEHVAALRSTPPRVDYFATSLPQTLLFAETPHVRRDRDVALLTAQLRVLDGGDAAADLRGVLDEQPDHLTARMSCSIPSTDHRSPVSTTRKER